MATILLVEDDQDLRFSVASTLRREGHDALEAGSVKEGLGVFAEHDADLIITDLRMPGEDGLALIKVVRDEGFTGGVLVMTSDDSVSTAVEAMKLGADEYLLKPLSVAELTLVVGRTIERGKRDARLRLHERMADQRSAEEPEAPVGEHPSWQAAISMVKRLAELPLPNVSGGPQALPTVLLVGETGTGKGVLARELHRAADPSSESPFVHVNCAALPANLIEAELFGHERGAFTDAKDSREGLFEMATNGTIFLDEIGELPMELQSKLLLVLEAATLRRIGGTRERRIRTRVVAATNQDLPARVGDKSFRSDLYYRLNTFTVAIPPLRERGDDAIAIARAALVRFGRRFGRSDLSLSENAVALIQRHEWPGNARQLVNAMQHAALLGNANPIEPSDIPVGRLGTLEATDSGLSFDFERGPCTIEDVERVLIEQALRYTNGNVTAAARLLDVQRSSIRNRIDRYELESLVRELSTP